MRAIASGRAAIIAITFAGSLLADYHFVTVEYPGQPLTSLSAINAGGLIVGLSYDSHLITQASFFTDTHGSLGPSFQYPGVTFTHSSGIDTAGDVIGQFQDFLHGAGAGVFLRSAAGAFTSLTLPAGLTFASGQAISGNGAIVLSANQSLYFRASDGSYTSVVVPGAGGLIVDSVNVTGIDNAGNVVGFYFTGGPTISFFRDTSGVFHTFQVPGPGYTEVEGMNNLGQAVGFYFDGTADHGFLWRGGNDFTTIDYPGATNTIAFGINDSGVIVGFYDDARGRHGLIALPGGVAPSPVPAPPSLWLAVTGCLALGGFWFLWRTRLA